MSIGPELQVTITAMWRWRISRLSAYDQQGRRHCINGSRSKRRAHDAASAKLRRMRTLLARILIWATLHGSPSTLPGLGKSQKTMAGAVGNDQMRPSWSLSATSQNGLALATMSPLQQHRSLADTSDVYWPSTPSYNRSNGRCGISSLSACDQHARRHCTRRFRSKRRAYDSAAAKLREDSYPSAED
jgi:hypothetical protein